MDLGPERVGTAGGLEELGIGETECGAERGADGGMGGGTECDADRSLRRRAAVGSTGPRNKPLVLRRENGNRPKFC